MKETNQFTLKNSFEGDYENTIIKYEGGEVKPGETGKISTGKKLTFWLSEPIPRGIKIMTDFTSSTGTEGDYTYTLKRSHDNGKSTPKWEIINESIPPANISRDHGTRTTANVTVSEGELPDIEPDRKD